mgnify:CR=1 FL=1
MCVFLALGCRTDPDQVGFGSNSTVVTTLPEGTSGGASSTGPGLSDNSSSSTTSGQGSGGSTGPRLDLGQGPDLESPQPAGCKGKIDFLFVISSGAFVEDIQEQLVDAFPKFIDTIETKFSDFDYHIMVVDGTAGWWGITKCNQACPMRPEPVCTNYACDYLGFVGPCETTYGAGTVFSADAGTLKKPCGVAGGKRYLTREQPQLKETFECVARVGVNGGDGLGYQLVQAVSPQLLGPGGCNEGFLRDAALLVVTLASRMPDDGSPGTPTEWAQAVIEAKHDDPNAIVVFGIGWPEVNGECHELDRLCQLVRKFPYSHWISTEEPDYGPGFETATDLVEVACGAFIPQ